MELFVDFLILCLRYASAKETLPWHIQALPMHVGNSPRITNFQCCEWKTVGDTRNAAPLYCGNKILHLECILLYEISVSFIFEPPPAPAPCLKGEIDHSFSIIIEPSVFFR